MSKPKKRNNRNANKANNNQENELKKLDDISKQTNEIKKDENITQEDLDNRKVEINTKDIKARNVFNQFDEVIKVKDILKEKQKEHEQLINDLQEKNIELEEQQKELLEQKKTLHETKKDYDGQLEEYNQLRIGNFSNIINKELVDIYESNLRKQEELLVQKISELDSRYNDFRILITEKRTELQDEFKEKFVERDNAIKELEKTLDERQKEINVQGDILDNEKEDFNFDKEEIKKDAQKIVQQEINNLGTTIANLKEQNGAYYQQISEFEEQLKYLGTDNPQKIKKKLQDSQEKVQELESIIDLDGEILDKDELKRLKIEKSEWSVKQREYEDEYRELKKHYDNQKVQVGEVEYHKFQIETYEKRFELQEEALNQMKDEYDELLEKSNTKEVFISCKDMDLEYADKDSSDPYDDGFTHNWLEMLKHTIADITKEKLYYHPDTLRSFIAGLAMSRLTILEGISGTGKTSLPKAFAQAICGKANNDGDEHYEVIEVQSGWKDRQDLLGYYNTFEKKYYESSFLKALYKANTPKFSNKPFFIILDEMNLSHPEHYFADLLSILEETDSSKRYLKICDKVNNNPNYMKEEKVELLLKIPENVWFVGTGNNDETTVGFADKTYDRANIMEMPKNPDSFKIDRTIEQEEVEQSNDNFLHELRDIKQYDNIDLVIDYINEDFKIVCRDLDIGWGNRLDKHIRKFVPVFIALGGSEADAVDHMIASKILRKLKDRYDLRAKKEKLEFLKEELESGFKEFFNKKAKKSIDIVNEALKNIEAI